MLVLRPAPPYGGGVADRALGAVLRVRGVDAPGVVHRAQFRQQALQALRQHLVGEVHAGEQGVAADRRNLSGVEQRGEGRPFQVAEIGMPGAAEVVAVLRVLRDLEDGRVAVERLHHRMHVQGAETAGEVDEVPGLEVLVLQEHDPVVEQRLVHREAPREVDARDLRAERQADGVDRDGHAGTAYRLPPTACRIERVSGRRRRLASPHRHPFGRQSVRRGGVSAGRAIGPLGVSAGPRRSRSSSR